MPHIHLRTFAVIGFLLSAAVTLYIVFGNHNLLGTRQPLNLDYSELDELREGETLLAHYAQLKLRCQPEQTPLGAQLCGAPLTDYEGIPADRVAFYFDADQRLTAVRLDLPAAHHEDLQRLYGERYGQPREDGGVASWAIADGRLALGAPENGQSTSLWIASP